MRILNWSLGLVEVKEFRGKMDELFKSLFEFILNFNATQYVYHLIAKMESKVKFHLKIEEHSDNQFQDQILVRNWELFIKIVSKQ